MRRSVWCLAIWRLHLRRLAAGLWSHQHPGVWCRQHPGVWAVQPDGLWQHHVWAGGAGRCVGQPHAYACLHSHALQQAGQGCIAGEGLRRCSAVEPTRSSSSSSRPWPCCRRVWRRVWRGGARHAGGGLAQNPGAGYQRQRHHQVGCAGVEEGQRARDGMQTDAPHTTGPCSQLPAWYATLADHVPGLAVAGQSTRVLSLSTHAPTHLLTLLTLPQLQWCSSTPSLACLNMSARAWRSCGLRTTRCAGGGRLAWPGA